MTSARIDWPAVIGQAREIVESYATSVTLRQLFYRLVSAQVIPNSQVAYKRLSALTAEARRDGSFPALIDRGRAIHEYQWFTGTGDALTWLSRIYRLDRTRDQDVSLYLGVEKAGMVVQLQSWFGDLGVPVLALGGYSSQTYTDDVAAHAGDRDRPAVLLYAGDFDPSGEDIDRDFIERSACWDKVIRVALSTGQVRDYRLPVNPGKVTDSRAAGFIERHGSLMQVELDALDPDDLRALYQAAVDRYWDTSAYEQVLDDEAAGRARLRDAATYTKELTMISDVLYDAANSINQYRKDFPDYDADPRIYGWLNVIVNELSTLGDVISKPPPPDPRTHRGECRECHQITVINLGTLDCEPCRAKIRSRLEELMEIVPTEEETDARLAAAHAEWLNEDTIRIVNHLRRLDKADRDHILAAINEQLLEAR